MWLVIYTGVLYGGVRSSSYSRFVRFAEEVFWLRVWLGGISEQYDFSRNYPGYLKPLCGDFIMWELPPQFTHNTTDTRTPRTPPHHPPSRTHAGNPEECSPPYPPSHPARQHPAVPPWNSHIRHHSAHTPAVLALTAVPDSSRTVYSGYMCLNPCAYNKSCRERSSGPGSPPVL